MGFKRYRGRVTTVEEAIMAHAVLVIRCQHCRRSNSMWAWQLREHGAAVLALKLGVPVSGFYCRGCRRSVCVRLTAEGPW